MNIMFVYGSLGNGGAQRVISLLTESLISKGHNIVLLVYNDSEKNYQYNAEIRVICYEKEHKKKPNRIERISAIRKEATDNNIDTIIAFSHYNAMYAWFALLGTKISVVASERNDPAQLEKSRVKNWLRERIYCSKRVKSLVFQTEDAKNYFPLKVQKKSRVILNPIDVSHLPEPYIGNRDKRIVSFSRLEPQKNIYMLVKAFSYLHKQYPDYILELYGEGSEKSAILKYIQDMKLAEAVFVYPFDENIHEKVKSASMFALASDYEGLSNSMIESMAIGLPVVVTDCPCGGARMVIEDGVNGFLVPVGDSEAMFEKMKYVVEHEDKSQEMALKATKIREKLDSVEICEQWIELLK